MKVAKALYSSGTFWIIRMERPTYYMDTRGREHEVSFREDRCIDSVISFERGFDGVERRVVRSVTISPDTPEMKLGRAQHYADQTAIAVSQGSRTPYWSKAGYSSEAQMLAESNRRRFW